nr:AT1 [Erythropodium caribaeorum]
MFESQGWMIAQTAITVAVVLIVRYILVQIYSSSIKLNLRTVSENERDLGALEIFFEETHKNGGPFICCTLIRLQSAISLSYDVVYKTLMVLAKKHPLLRARILERESGEKYRKCFVVNNTNEPVIPLQKHKQFDADEYLEALEQELHTGFEDRGLVWRVVYLKEKQNVSENSFENSLIFVTHHGITDGISAISLAEQFCRGINITAKANQEIFDDTESYAMTADLLELIKDEIAWSWWQRLLLIPQTMALFFKVFQVCVRIKPVKNIFLDSFPTVAKEDYGRRGKTRIVYKEMDEIETRKLMKACKANNCTVQGAVAVAWHLATRRLMATTDSQLQDPCFQWYCPVSVRKYCKPVVPPDYVGCFVSSVIDQIKMPSIETAEEFWAMAQRCTRVLHKQISQRKHLHLLRVYDLVDLVKFVPEFKLLTRDPTVHGLTNMGCFYWRSESDLFKTKQCFLATGNHHYGMIFHNHISTINGRFNVATSYFDTVVNGSIAKQLVELAFDALQNAGVPRNRVEN